MSAKLTHIKKRLSELPKGLKGAISSYATVKQVGNLFYLKYGKGPAMELTYEEALKLISVQDPKVKFNG